MNLSERALKYLNSLTREVNWTSNVDETRAYLINQNINPLDEFLRYQEFYSGYVLTIKDKPGGSFSAGLFSSQQIQKNEPLEVEKIGERTLEICGAHSTAQFAFFITDKGEICTLDKNDVPNVIYSSFDKMVEEYALRNEIHHWDSNPHYFNVMNLKALEYLMNDEFQIIKECSDEYSTWWKNDDVIAVKGIWLDRPESYFHVYGVNRNICDNLINRLKKEEIL